MAQSAVWWSLRPSLGKRCRSRRALPIGRAVTARPVRYRAGRRAKNFCRIWSIFRPPPIFSCFAMFGAVRGPSHVSRGSCDDPRSQPLRYERFRSETAGSLAVAYEAVSPRRSPLCLSDSGAALIGPLPVAALDRAARVFSQPDATARPSKTCKVVSDGSHLAGVISRNKWGTAGSSSSPQNAAEKI